MQESPNRIEPRDLDNKISSQSTDCVCESSEPEESNSRETLTKEDNSGAGAKEAVSVLCEQGDNSEAQIREDMPKGDDSDVRGTLKGGHLEEKQAAGDSDDKVKGDSSQTEEECSEIEKMDSAKDDEKIEDSYNSAHDEHARCLPVLTYLDESCSRCRINNWALTLKSKVEEGGRDLLDRIYVTAQRFDKERLIRILDDVHAGKIVTRAESHKVLEEPDT